MHHTLVYGGHIYAGHREFAATGIFRCKNRDSYAGEYEGDRMHGIGVHAWAVGAHQGDVYRGQWEWGQMEGHGVYEWARGAVYGGQHKAGKMEGLGVCHYTSRNVYHGLWKEGKRDGHAVYTRASGKRTFDHWEGDKELSSVPFNEANSEHAAVLREANDAEARRLGAPHRPGRDRLTSRALQAQAAAAAAKVKVRVRTLQEARSALCVCF